GHMFPPYLHFHGGKGVATGFGVMAVLLPGPLGWAMLSFGTVLLGTRYMSLASVLAGVTLAGVQIYHQYSYDQRGANSYDQHGTIDPRTAFAVVGAALVAIRHRGNIRRIRSGVEPRMVQESIIVNALTRMVHIVATGLWFGAAVFFT